MQVPQNNSQQVEPQRKIYLIRATAVNYNERDKARPYRTFAFRASHSLRRLGHAIVRSFKFNWDNSCFGFYESRDYQTNRIIKAKIYEVFKDIGQKKYFFFGCYNEWEIIVELMGIVEPKPKIRYPHLIRSVGKSPRQYPVEQTKDTIREYYLGPDEIFYCCVSGSCECQSYSKSRDYNLEHDEEMELPF